MKCSVFIAPSVDGYIASSDGGVQWLESVGKTLSKEEEASDTMEHFRNAFPSFIKSVDCMIMGSNLMNVLSGFNLSPEQWPYVDTKIIVLSKSIKDVPKNLKGKLEIYSGDIPELMNKLEKEGYKHAYIDGGKTINSFLNLGLINELTLTQAPVLLGSGIPLFGTLSKQILLENAQAIAFENNFIEIKYTVKYPH